MVTTRGKNIKLDLDLSEGEVDEEAGVEAKPAPKRRRTKNPKSSEDESAFNPGSSSSKGKAKAFSGQNQLITRRNGKGGKLRDLMNMPVDIFTEVCTYLDPYDLRRLALTSKRLRNILMTKDAKHIWKTAIASVHGLPECPTDLNEPQYVCLLYSSECYTTGCTSRGTRADWFHRVRFCSACHAERMTDCLTLCIDYGALGLDLNEATLSQIMRYFDSDNAMDLEQDYPRYSRKVDERHYHIEAIKKAGHEYEALSGEEAREYLSRLEERRDYQAKTGTAMLKWKHIQLASRADEIAAEKNARFESIKVKLLEMGWDEKDFPISQKEFRDLVFKDQKLTPKIWQNIMPKLEILLEAQRSNRLETERRVRRISREKAIGRFYHRLGLEIMNLPLTYYSLRNFLPQTDKVFALPSIKPLLELDTETITEDQPEWIKVVPDVRLFVLKWWRDCLEQFAARLDHGLTGSANKTQATSKETDTETDTEEEVSASIASLRAKLSYATAVFSCEGCRSKTVCRFPHLIEHVMLSHSCYSMDQALDMLRPPQPDDQELVMRLLKDLKLDAETAKVDSSVDDKGEKNLLCTRCDERVAKYMSSLDDLISHFRESKRWFESVTGYVRRAPDVCYPSLTVGSQLPKIVNDHDWSANDALLARRDGKETKDAVLKVQRDFLEEELNNQLCDTEGIRGEEDLEKTPRTEVVVRSCLLCPRFYAPYPCSAGKIELHIRSKHDKEPDLENDTTLERRYPSHSCPS